MRKLIQSILILLFFSSFCFAQEPKQPKTIETHVGENFTIALESNATTGYQWKFTKPLDKDMLELISASHVINNPKLIGSAGKQVWTITALKSGKTTIFFKYVRPWEKDKPPIKEESVRVVIKEKQEDTSTLSQDAATGKGPSKVRVGGDITVTSVNRKGF